MKVLLDTNVVLDLLLGREPWRAEAQAIAEADADGRIQAYVCATSITDIFYIARKLVGTVRARGAVRVCLDTLRVVSVTRELLIAAEQRAGDDYEDNLQVECALGSRLDVIVSRDLTGFEGAPIAVLTPAELIARFDRSTDS